MSWLLCIICNVCTKYEVSIFIRSKDIKGVQKFGNWSLDLRHAPLGVNFSYANKGLCNVLAYKVLERVALSIHKLFRGPKFLI